MSYAPPTNHVMTGGQYGEVTLVELTPEDWKLEQLAACNLDESKLLRGFLELELVGPISHEPFAVNLTQDWVKRVTGVALSESGDLAAVTLGDGSCSIVEIQKPILGLGTHRMTEFQRGARIESPDNFQPLVIPHISESGSVMLIGNDHVLRKWDFSTPAAITSFPNLELIAQRSSDVASEGIRSRTLPFGNQSDIIFSDNNWWLFDFSLLSTNGKTLVWDENEVRQPKWVKRAIIDADHNDELLAVAYSDGSLGVIDLATDEMLHELQTSETGKRMNWPTGGIGTFVALHPAGNLLASCIRTQKGETRLNIWDLSKKFDDKPTPAYVMNLPSPGTHRLAFSPDGKQLAIADEISSLSVFEVAQLQDGAESPAKPLFTNLIPQTAKMVYSRDSKMLVLTGQRATDDPRRAVLVLDAQTGGEVDPRDGVVKESSKISETGHLLELYQPARLGTLGSSMIVTACGFSPDGKTLAIGANDGRLNLWSWEDGKCVLLASHFMGSLQGWAISGEGLSVGHVAFADTGERLCVAMQSGATRVFEMSELLKPSDDNTMQERTGLMLSPITGKLKTRPVNHWQPQNN